ncbi:MAG: hypothetical protein RRX93_01455 [Bacteroidales bacterium]
MAEPTVFFYFLAHIKGLNGFYFYFYSLWQNRSDLYTTFASVQPMLLCSLCFCAAYASVQPMKNYMFYSDYYGLVPELVSTSVWFRSLRSGSVCCLFVAYGGYYRLVGIIL